MNRAGLPWGNDSIRWGMIGTIAVTQLMSPTFAQAAVLSDWVFDPATQALTVTLPAGITPRYFLLAEPARFVMDIPNTQMGAIATEQVYSGSVRSIRVSQFDANTIRIVMELAPGVVLDPRQAQLSQQTAGSQQAWTLQPLLAGQTAVARAPASSPAPARPSQTQLPNIPNPAPTEIEVQPAPQPPATALEAAPVTSSPSGAAPAAAILPSLPTTSTNPPSTSTAALPTASAPGGSVSGESMSLIDGVPAYPPFIPESSSSLFPGQDFNEVNNGEVSLSAAALATGSVTTTSDLPDTLPLDPFALDSGRSGRVSVPPLSNSGSMGSAIPTQPSVTVPPLAAANPAPANPAVAASPTVAVPPLGTPLAPETAAVDTSDPIGAIPASPPFMLASNSSVQPEVAPPVPHGTAPVPTATSDSASPMPPFLSAPASTIPSASSPMVIENTGSASPVLTGSAPSQAATTTSAIPESPPFLTTPGSSPVQPQVTPTPSISQSPTARPNLTATSTTIPFGQPLPTVAIAAADHGDQSPTLIPVSTILPLQYTHSQPLELRGTAPWQEVLVVSQDVYNSAGTLVVPAGAQVIGRFEVSASGRRFVAQAIALYGRNFSLSAQSETYAAAAQTMVIQPNQVISVQVLQDLSWR